MRFIMDFVPTYLKYNNLETVRFNFGLHVHQRFQKRLSS